MGLPMCDYLATSTPVYSILHEKTVFCEIKRTIFAQFCVSNPMQPLKSSVVTLSYDFKTKNLLKATLSLDIEW